MTVFYTDGDNFDADRDAVLVGDPYSADWPEAPLRRNTFTTVAPSYPGAARSRIPWNPTASHTDQPGDGTPPPSSGPVPPSRTSSARRSPGAV